MIIITDLEIALVKYDGIDDLAYKALKEMQKREKGCEHCKDGKPIYSEEPVSWRMNDVFAIGREKGKWFIFSRKYTHSDSGGDFPGMPNYASVCADIEYCPKCGRRLEA